MKKDQPPIIQLIANKPRATRVALSLEKETLLETLTSEQLEEVGTLLLAASPPESKERWPIPEDKRRKRVETAPETLLG